MVSPEQSNQSAPARGNLQHHRQVYSSTQEDKSAPIQEQSASFASEEGRKILLEEWLNRCLDEGKIDLQRLYTVQERAVLLENWLCTLISEGRLDPHRRLPPYATLGEPPFNLREKDVAHVISELRNAGLFPQRKTRMDKGQPLWTLRDNYCFEWIGHMRAIRYDQLQRLLARHSEYETGDPSMLSISRVSKIIARWSHAKYAIYRRVYAKQPGWIYLARKGLFHAGLDYRASPPRDRLLEHIYWINEVRLKLEETEPSIQWISERAIQALQEKRQKGQRLQHIPDGIVVRGMERIDIEVQISRPSQQAVELVMRSLGGNSVNPLRYYASESAIAVVRKAYDRVMKGGWYGRPRIEIVELEEFLQPLERESE